MNEYKINLSKEYNFEGAKIKDIDLSSILDLNAEQVCRCERQFEMSGAVSTLKEMNLEFCLIVAAEISKLPIEFYKQLRVVDAMKVKKVITQHFFQEA